MDLKLVSGPMSLLTGLMTDPFDDYVRRSTKSLLNHFLDLGVPTEMILPAMDEEMDLFEVIIYDKNNANG